MSKFNTNNNRFGRDREYYGGGRTRQNYYDYDSDQKSNYNHGYKERYSNNHPYYANKYQANARKFKTDSNVENSGNVYYPKHSNYYPAAPVKPRRVIAHVIRPNPVAKPNTSLPPRFQRLNQARPYNNLEVEIRNDTGESGAQAAPDHDSSDIDNYNETAIDPLVDANDADCSNDESEEGNSPDGAEERESTGSPVANVADADRDKDDGDAGDELSPDNEESKEFDDIMREFYTILGDKAVDENKSIVPTSPMDAFKQVSIAATTVNQGHISKSLRGINPMAGTVVLEPSRVDAKFQVGEATVAEVHTAYNFGAKYPQQYSLFSEVDRIKSAPSEKEFDNVQSTLMGLNPDANLKSFKNNDPSFSSSAVTVNRVTTPSQYENIHGGPRPIHPNIQQSFNNIPPRMGQRPRSIAPVGTRPVNVDTIDLGASVPPVRPNTFRPNLPGRFLPNGQHAPPRTVRPNVPFTAGNRMPTLHNQFSPNFQQGHTNTCMTAIRQQSPSPILGRGGQNENFADAAPRQQTSDTAAITNQQQQVVPATTESDRIRFVETIRQIKSSLDFHIKVLVIMRGPPGCGKSTLARLLNTKSGLILATDDFFSIQNNQTKYDFSRLSEAHEWNKCRARNAVARSISPVFIDNTNIQGWEMKFYILLGMERDYQIFLLEPDTPWKFDSKELAKRSIHGVNRERIDNMIRRYDRHLTIEKILGPDLLHRLLQQRKARAEAAAAAAASTPPASVTPNASSSSSSSSGTTAAQNVVENEKPSIVREHAAPSVNIDQMIGPKEQREGRFPLQSHTQVAPSAQTSNHHNRTEVRRDEVLLSTRAAPPPPQMEASSSDLKIGAAAAVEVQVVTTEDAPLQQRLRFTQGGSEPAAAAHSSLQMKLAEMEKNVWEAGAGNGSDNDAAAAAPVGNTSQDDAHSIDSDFSERSLEASSFNRRDRASSSESPDWNMENVQLPDDNSRLSGLQYEDAFSNMVAGDERIPTPSAAADKSAAISDFNDLNNLDTSANIGMKYRATEECKFNETDRQMLYGANDEHVDLVNNTFDDSELGLADANIAVYAGVNNLNRNIVETETDQHLNDKPVDDGEPNEEPLTKKAMIENIMKRLSNEPHDEVDPSRLPNVDVSEIDFLDEVSGGADNLSDQIKQDMLKQLSNHETSSVPTPHVENVAEISGPFAAASNSVDHQSIVTRNLSTTNNDTGEDLTAALVEKIMTDVKKNKRLTIQVTGVDSADEFTLPLPETADNKKVFLKITPQEGGDITMEDSLATSTVTESKDKLVGDETTVVIKKDNIDSLDVPSDAGASYDTEESASASTSTRKVSLVSLDSAADVASIVSATGGGGGVVCDAPAKDTVEVDAPKAKSGKNKKKKKRKKGSAAAQNGTSQEAAFQVTESIRQSSDPEVGGTIADDDIDEIVARIEGEEAEGGGGKKNKQKGGGAKQSAAATTDIPTTGSTSYGSSNTATSLTLSKAKVNEKNHSRNKKSSGYEGKSTEKNPSLRNVSLTNMFTENHFRQIADVFAYQRKKDEAAAEARKAECASASDADVAATQRAAAFSATRDLSPSPNDESSTSKPSSNNNTKSSTKSKSASKATCTGAAPTPESSLSLSTPIDEDEGFTIRQGRPVVFDLTKNKMFPPGPDEICEFTDESIIEGQKRIRTSGRVEKLLTNKKADICDVIKTLSMSREAEFYAKTLECEWQPEICVELVDEDGRLAAELAARHTNLGPEQRAQLSATRGFKYKYWNYIKKLPGSSIDLHDMLGTKVSGEEIYQFAKRRGGRPETAEDDVREANGEFKVTRAAALGQSVDIAKHFAWLIYVPPYGRKLKFSSERVLSLVMECIVMGYLVIPQGTKFSLYIFVDNGCLAVFGEPGHYSNCPRKGVRVKEACPCGGFKGEPAFIGSHVLEPPVDVATLSSDEDFSHLNAYEDSGNIKFPHDIFQCTITTRKRRRYLFDPPSKKSMQGLAHKYVQTDIQGLLVHRLIVLSPQARLQRLTDIFKVPISLEDLKRELHWLLLILMKKYIRDEVQSISSFPTAAAATHQAPPSTARSRRKKPKVPENSENVKNELFLGKNVIVAKYDNPTQPAAAAEEVKAPEEVKTPPQEVKSPHQEVKRPPEEVKIPPLEIPFEKGQEAGEDLKTPGEDGTAPIKDINTSSEEVQEPADEIKESSEKVTKTTEVNESIDDLKKPVEEDVERLDENVTEPIKRIKSPSEETKNPTKDVASPFEEGKEVYDKMVKPADKDANKSAEDVKTTSEDMKKHVENVKQLVEDVGNLGAAINNTNDVSDKCATDAKDPTERMDKLSDELKKPLEGLLETAEVVKATDEAVQKQAENVKHITKRIKKLALEVPMLRMLLEEDASVMQQVRANLEASESPDDITDFTQITSLLAKVETVMSREHTLEEAVSELQTVNHMERVLTAMVQTIARGITRGFEMKMHGEVAGNIEAEAGADPKSEKDVAGTSNEDNVEDKGTPVVADKVNMTPPVADVNSRSCTSEGESKKKKKSPGRKAPRQKTPTKDATGKKEEAEKVAQFQAEVEELSKGEASGSWTRKNLRLKKGARQRAAASFHSGASGHSTLKGACASMIPQLDLFREGATASGGGGKKKRGGGRKIDEGKLRLVEKDGSILCLSKEIAEKYGYHSSDEEKLKIPDGKIVKADEIKIKRSDFEGEDSFIVSMAVTVQKNQGQQQQVEPEIREPVPVKELVFPLIADQKPFHSPDPQSYHDEFKYEKIRNRVTRYTKDLCLHPLEVSFKDITIADPLPIETVKAVYPLVKGIDNVMRREEDGEWDDMAWKRKFGNVCILLWMETGKEIASLFKRLDESGEFHIEAHIQEFRKCIVKVYAKNFWEAFMWFMESYPDKTEHLFEEMIAASRAIMEKSFYMKLFDEMMNLLRRNYIYILGCDDYLYASTVMRKVSRAMADVYYGKLGGKITLAEMMKLRKAMEIMENLAGDMIDDINIVNAAVKKLDYESPRYLMCTNEDVHKRYEEEFERVRLAIAKVKRNSETAEKFLRDNFGDLLDLRSHFLTDMDLTSLMSFADVRGEADRLEDRRSGLYSGFVDAKEFFSSISPPISFDYKEQCAQCSVEPLPKETPLGKHMDEVKMSTDAVPKTLIDIRRPLLDQIIDIFGPIADLPPDEMTDDMMEVLVPDVALGKINQAIRQRVIDINYSPPHVEKDAQMHTISEQLDEQLDALLMDTTLPTAAVTASHSDAKGVREDGDPASEGSHAGIDNKTEEAVKQEKIEEQQDKMDYALDDVVLHELDAAADAVVKKAKAEDAAAAVLEDLCKASAAPLFAEENKETGENH